MRSWSNLRRDQSAAHGTSPVVKFTQQVIALNDSPIGPPDLEVVFQHFLVWRKEVES